MSRGVQDKVELGYEAMRRHAWEEARALLAEADAEKSLDAEGLRQLGKAQEWCGNVAGCIDAFERSYAAFVNAGNRRGAAKVALMLRHQCANSLQDPAAARGWRQRAERLLESEPECVELGFLWRSQGRGAFIDGNLEEGRRLLLEAIELANRMNQPNLMAMSMSWLGLSLSLIGKSEEGYPYLDEACAAAVGGELGPWATGIVYCNTISAYREAGEFGVAGKWTHTAGRWCERESITGFPGICRVHRAEFMRLRGSWADAEKEARRASGELENSLRGFAGDAQYEVGLIRMRPAISLDRRRHSVERTVSGASPSLARRCCSRRRASSRRPFVLSRPLSPRSHWGSSTTCVALRPSSTSHAIWRKSTWRRRQRTASRRWRRDNAALDCRCLRCRHVAPCSWRKET